jgi:hypothetical protein
MVAAFVTRGPRFSDLPSGQDHERDVHVNQPRICGGMAEPAIPAPSRVHQARRMRLEEI